MAWNIVPLDSYPDQEIHVTVTAGGSNIPLILHIRYNTEGEYWRMDISDRGGDMLLSGVPLFTGEYPTADLLRQFGHLGIGSLMILGGTDEADGERPGPGDLGSDYILLWGDGEID